MLLIIKHFKIV